MRLAIDDLQGRRLYACDDLRSMIDVALPAGTYHVTVRHGGDRRRYTVALEQGATFNLQLPHAAKRR